MNECLKKESGVVFWVLLAGKINVYRRSSLLDTTGSNCSSSCFVVNATPPPPPLRCSVVVYLVAAEIFVYFYPLMVSGFGPYGIQLVVTVVSTYVI